MPEPLLTRYLQPLLAGRRAECFAVIRDAILDGSEAEDLICDVVWPAMAQIERLFSDDRINTAVEHMASRINRTVADQLQLRLPTNDRLNKRIVIACADEFREELGAQMVADLFQSAGWEVFFVGGGVPDDEILGLVGVQRPQALLLFGADPQQVPQIRRLVELIREIGVCPTMNIVVSGGVFGRAEGLWQEVGVDAYAPSVREVVDLVSELPARAPGPPRRGVVKKRQRRRRTAQEAVTKAISKAEAALEGIPMVAEKASN
jgi:methanogenic corrinoid protein MtbC1